MRRSLTLLATVAILIGLVAAPAAANFDNGPDESGVVHRANYPFGMAFVDAESGLVALGGPPPVQGCRGQGFDDADFLEVFTPAGPVKVLIHGTNTFWIYEASSIDEVCEAALTTGIDPIFIAHDAKVRVTDNFTGFEPGSRANPFGGNANGTAYDVDENAWSFHASQKLMLDRDGNFTVRSETIKLRKLGG